jgi:hypothetical protein
VFVIAIISRVRWRDRDQVSLRVFPQEALVSRRIAPARAVHEGSMKECTMTMSTTANETSVMTSLAELARIERERVREESAQRAHTRREAARVEADRAAERLRIEEASIAAERLARAEDERKNVEARIRAEARERAAADVARIEAAAKVQLDVDNAVRAHELAVIRVRAHENHGRLVWVLAALLAVALCSGAALAFETSRRVTELTREADRLRDRERVLTEDVARAKLAGVDALAAQARLATTRRIAAIDRRHTDLTAWATQQRRSDVESTLAAAKAEVTARGGDEGALDTYEQALDRLRNQLATIAPVQRRTLARASAPAQLDCRDDDPICGINPQHL